MLHRVGAVFAIDGTAASRAQTSKMLSSLSDLRAKFVERIDILTAASVSLVSGARTVSRLVEMVCCTTGLAACYFHVIKLPECALRVSDACAIISTLQMASEYASCATLGKAPARIRGEPVPQADLKP